MEDAHHLRLITLLHEMAWDKDQRGPRRPLSHGGRCSPGPSSWLRGRRNPGAVQLQKESPTRSHRPVIILSSGSARQFPRAGRTLTTPLLAIFQLCAGRIYDPMFLPRDRQAASEGGTTNGYDAQIGKRPQLRGNLACQSVPKPQLLQIRQPPQLRGIGPVNPLPSTSFSRFTNRPSAEGMSPVK